MIGIFGGSFDPVHPGHVETARELLERLPFDEIRLLPAACSPFKQTLTPNDNRAAMLRLAIDGVAGLTLDTREFNRPPPSYTIDTLRELRAELGPEVSLVLIMGMDSFKGLRGWKDWQTIPTLAHLVVVTRPGHDHDLPAWLTNGVAGHLTTDPELLLQTPAGQLLVQETQPWPVSSTAIRSWLKQPDDKVPCPLAPDVAKYIHDHGLYR